MMSPLHTDFSLPSKKKSSKLPTEKEIQQRVVTFPNSSNQLCHQSLLNRWERKILQYLQLLERFRRGECNYSDYELLQTRVVGQPMVGSLRRASMEQGKPFLFLEKLFDHLFIQAPILVFRNEVRTQLNHKAAIHKAKQLGCAPMVCVAQDTCKGKPLEDPVHSSEKC